MRGPAAVLLALVAACNGSPPGPGGPEPGSEVFARACTATPAPVPGVTLPAGFPGYDGWTATRTAKQGATTLYFGTAPAPENDLRLVQQRLTAQVEGAGLTVVSTDREGQAEADVQFDGRYEGSAQVTPLCRGSVQIRYRFSG